LPERTLIKPLKNHGQGIPTVLENLRYEKISEVVPVKMQLSLKLCLKRVAGSKGVSGWIREVIIEKLEREK
jgi:hypothetical protein